MANILDWVAKGTASMRIKNPVHEMTFEVVVMGALYWVSTLALRDEDSSSMGVDFTDENYKNLPVLQMPTCLTQVTQYVFEDATGRYDELSKQHCFPNATVTDLKDLCSDADRSTYAEGILGCLVIAYLAIKIIATVSRKCSQSQRSEGRPLLPNQTKHQDLRAALGARPLVSNASKYRYYDWGTRIARVVFAMSFVSVMFVSYQQRRNHNSDFALRCLETIQACAYCLLTKLNAAVSLSGLPATAGPDRLSSAKQYVGMIGVSVLSSALLCGPAVMRAFSAWVKNIGKRKEGERRQPEPGSSGNAVFNNGAGL